MKNIPFLLLIALVAFGCQEEIGVIGCTDELAYNFNADAEVDNGNCQYIEGCTDPAALNYNEYAMIMDGSCVYEGEDGGETTENPNDPCEGQDVLTYHGYDYPLVAVGSQCWMKENLRTTIKNTGESLVIDTILTDGYSQGEIAFWNDAPDSIDTYGVFYRSFSPLMGSVCPVGWRPSEFADIEVLSTESNVTMAMIGHRIKASSPEWNGVDQFGLSFVQRQQIFSDFNNPFQYQVNTTRMGNDPNYPSGPYFVTSAGTNVTESAELGGEWYGPIRCIKE